MFKHFIVVGALALPPPPKKNYFAWRHLKVKAYQYETFMNGNFALNLE